MSIKININNDTTVKQLLSADNPLITDEAIQQSIFLTAGVLKTLDTNGDGIIADDEINELYEIDQNGDKNISDAELQSSKLNGQDVGIVESIKSFFTKIGFTIGDEKKLSQETQNAGKDVLKAALAEQIGNFFKANDQNVENVVTLNDLVGKNLEEFKAIINANPELKKLFGSDSDIENLFNQIKKSDSDKLTEDDVKALVKLDGNDKELSSKDVETFLANPTKTEGDSQPVQKQQSADNQPSSSSTSSPSGSPTSSSAPTSQTTTEQRTPEVIKQEIADKQGEIVKVNTDEEAKVKTEEDNYDASVTKAMEEANIDKEIQKEYEDRKSELDKEIATQNGNIQTAEAAIQDNTAIIDAKTSAIDAIDGQIASLQGSLASIKDTGDQNKDKDNQAKKDDINSKINNLKLAQDKLKAERETAKTNKDKAVSDKNTATNARNTAEQNRGNLVAEMAKDPKYAALNAITDKIAEFKTTRDENIQKIRQDQDTQVNALNQTVQSLKTELAKAEEKEKTVALLKDNRAPGNAEGSIDFAKMYENMTEEQMKSIFAGKNPSGKFYQFDSGEWCADFVRMAMLEGVGKDNLPEWYVNSANPASCQNLYNEAKTNDAIINLADAKPGDMVLFDWDNNGSADHVGIFVDKGDGVTIQTIEGNTFINGASRVSYRDDRKMNTVLAIVSMGPK